MDEVLTVEKVNKIVERAKYPATDVADVEEYLFVGQKVGEVNGLKDGQLLSNGTVQVIFTKTLGVA